MVKSCAWILLVLCIIHIAYGLLNRLNRSFFIYQLRSKISAMNDYEQRFTNVARLYQSERNPTKDILQRLLNTHVCIIGLGGVGSWVTESLARNGIGRLTLIDMDDVCISNINRQVMAQTSTIGKFKAESLKSRILDINPSAEVNIMMDFVRPSSAVSIITTASQGAPSGATSSHLQGQFDYVIDAVDSSADKAAIIDACVSSGTPVVTCGGVGGLTDPTLLTVSDLAHAEGDALLYHVRRTLRREYGYPSHKEKEEGEANQAFTQKTGRATGRVRKWGILAVHTRPTGISRSPVRTQRTSAESGSSDDEAEKVAVGSCSISSDSDIEGGSTPSSTAADSGGGRSSSMRVCDTGLGNACFVTGAVGLLMSSCVVNAVGWGVAVNAVVTAGAVHLAVRPRRLGKHFSATPMPVDRAGPVIGHSNVSIEEVNRKDNVEAAIQSEDDCSCGKQSVSISGAGGEACVESADFAAYSRRQQEQNIQSLIRGVATLVRVDAADTVFSPLFDAHCHVQLSPLYAHSAAALNFAKACNISRFSICGTAPGQDWYRIRTLYETNPSSVLPSFGLHPWYINAYFSNSSTPNAIITTTTSADISISSALCDWQAQLESLLRQIPCAGVGEAGLDKPGKVNVEMALQEQVLRAHIQLAAQYQRVLTLHCVAGCWDRLYQILSEQQKKRDGALKTHEPSCISEVGRPEQHAQAMPSAVILHSCNSLPLHLVPLFARLHNTYFSLSMGGGCYISSGGSSGGDSGGDSRGDIGKVSEKVVALVKSIPPHRLLIETDSPDQLPAQMRRRNVGIPVESPVTSAAAAAGAGGEDSSSLSLLRLQYNEPALLQYHCFRLSEALGVSYQQLAAQTYGNACRAFGVAP